MLDKSKIGFLSFDLGTSANLHLKVERWSFSVFLESDHILWFVGKKTELTVIYMTFL